MAQWSEADATAKIAKAQDDKTAADTIYRDAVELTFPDRDGFTVTNEGQNKARRNWDGAVTASIIRTANRIVTDYFPGDWAEVGLGKVSDAYADEEFAKRFQRDKDRAKEELERITAVVRAVFSGPGFITALGELVLDWLYGQGGMMIDRNPDPAGPPVIFRSMGLSHFYAYEGPFGVHDQWFFWHSVRADKVQAMWPDAILPVEIQEKAAETKPPMLEFTTVIYRDYDERERPFRHEVFSKGTRGQNTMQRIVERRSRTSPAVTPRHSKLAGENRGRGPILFALPDIRTVNKIVELTLRSVAIEVAGIYTAVADEVSGPVNILPAAVINVKSNGGSARGPSMQRLATGGRIDFAQLVMATLHEQIKRTIGDNSLPPEADPIRTATEFIQRARELMAEQAGGLARLKSEFAVPAIQRVIDLMEQAGALQSDGLQIDQFFIEARMTSPLARGEDLRAVENVARFLEMMTGLTSPEEVRIEIDTEKAISMIADLMDVPASIRNNPEQKRKIKDGLTRAAAQAAGADPEQAAGAMQEIENAGTA